VKKYKGIVLGLSLIYGKILLSLLYAKNCSSNFVCSLIMIRQIEPFLTLIAFLLFNPNSNTCISVLRVVDEHAIRVNKSFTFLSRVKSWIFVNLSIIGCIFNISRVQMISGAGKALETFNCCAFLKRRFIGVCWLLT
jgi:hypothetical protein